MQMFVFTLTAPLGKLWMNPELQCMCEMGFVWKLNTLNVTAQTATSKCLGVATRKDWH